jgi:hypothetical protein
VREKLGTVAVVVVLVVAWGGGFLWFRGDYSLPLLGTKGKPTAAAEKKPVTAPKVTKQTPTASPSASYDGTITLAQERKAVDINPEPKRPAPVPLPPVATWRMATFNLLGAAHTGGHGKDPGRPSGTRRMQGALQIIAQHQVSVVGFQEMEGSQRDAFLHGAPKWQLFPGNSMGNAGENSIGWDTDVWTLVKPQTIPIPYFGGKIRPMPYILLQNKATGVVAYFANFHNPADIRQFKHQFKFRLEAEKREVTLFNSLEKTGIPVFVTGDMNEREQFFCAVVGATTLHAAAGGSVSGGCNPPRPTQIDWILGSKDVVFSDYDIDKSSLVHFTTDHPVVSAAVSLDSLKYPKAYQPTLTVPSPTISP